MSLETVNTNVDWVDPRLIRRSKSFLFWERLIQGADELAYTSRRSRPTLSGDFASVVGSAVAATLEAPYFLAKRALAKTAQDTLSADLIETPHEGKYACLVVEGRARSVGLVAEMVIGRVQESLDPLQTPQN